MDKLSRFHLFDMEKTFKTFDQPIFDGEALEFDMETASFLIAGNGETSWALFWSGHVLKRMAEAYQRSLDYYRSIFKDNFDCSQEIPAIHPFAIRCVQMKKCNIVNSKDRSSLFKYLTPNYCPKSKPLFDKTELQRWLDRQDFNAALRFEFSHGSEKELIDATLLSRPLPRGVEPVGSPR